MKYEKISSIVIFLVLIPGLCLYYFDFDLSSFWLVSVYFYGLLKIKNR